MLARGFRNAIGKAKDEATLALPAFSRGAREGIELIARLDASRGVIGALAETSPRQPAGIGFIDGDYLVNAVHESARNRIFEHAGALCSRTLHNKEVARQRVNRERADVGHSPTGALIRPAVPFVGCLLRFVGRPFAQRVELEPHLLAKHRLYIGKR